MVEIMEETIRNCLYYGYSLTPIRWMEDDLKVTTKKEAIIILNRIISGFIKEFNRASCPSEIQKANEHKLNKAILLVVEHFEKKEKSKKMKVEEISENFIRVNLN